MTIEEFENESRIIRKEILDQLIVKKPKIYSLKSAGNRLFEIVKTMKSDNAGLVITLESLKMDLENYLVDLKGELQHDYDKNNKKYRGKWEKESRKIDEFIYRIKQYLLVK
jgi:hypothetical protein